MKKIIITLFFILTLLPFAIAQENELVLDTNDLGVVIIQVDEYKEPSFWDKLFNPSLYTIVLTPSIPSPGQRTKVDTLMNIEYDGLGIKSSYIYLKKGTSSLKTIEITPTVKYKCPQGGCSLMVQTYFDAPSTEGTYSVEIKTIGNSMGVISNDGETFQVQNEVTSCPNNGWTSFTFVYNTDDGHGQVFSRQYKSYELVNNNCQQTLGNLDYKTICESGYHVQGTTNTISTGIKTCEPDQETPKICTPGEIIDNACTNSKISETVYCNSLGTEQLTRSTDCSLQTDFVCIQSTGLCGEEASTTPPDDGSGNTDPEDDIVTLEGCTYNNPACGDDEYCVDNVCEPLSNPSFQGCDYNNPSCTIGESCIDNSCVATVSCPADCSIGCIEDGVTCKEQVSLKAGTLDNNCRQFQPFCNEGLTCDSEEICRIDNTNAKVLIILGSVLAGILLIVGLIFYMRRK